MGKLPFETRDERIVVKRQDVSTNPDYGKNPRDRDTETYIKYGLVNIDKPAGPTSHQVSAYARDIIGAKKCGHSGTLDPNVTGCLPIASEKATRVMQNLLTAGKEYVCLMKLHKEVSDNEIRKVVKSFEGLIEQLPPVKSAVKRQRRKRMIYYIDIHEIKDDRFVLFTVGCQAGTYIRKLCHDIGERLEVGANMQELRRTKAGGFTEDTLVTLHDLKDAIYYYKEEGDDSYIRKIMLPIEYAAKHLPKIWVTDLAVNSLCHGSQLKCPGVVKFHDDIKEGDRVAVMTLKDELVLVGDALMNSKDLMKKDRGVCVKTAQVFIDPSLYKPR
jgi:H/ACA ribonucleoprotein complex subunit 4